MTRARSRTESRAGRAKGRVPERGSEDEKSSEWKLWLRDIGVAVLVLVIILLGMYAYTGVWPPLVVVESQSMQHGDQMSYLGVIDTGDLVFVQAAPQRSDIVTYIEGRATGYATYGDYGDVIIFHPNADLSVTPIIHRAILWARPNGTGFADVPDLALLPASDWGADNASGQPTHSPYQIRSVWIRGMGFNHDLNITFAFAQNSPNGFGSRGPGFVTMGDNNAFHECVPNSPCAAGYDRGWFAVQSDIIGHARGEIPWFGLLKLLLAPSPQGCCNGWGDPTAPPNSWTDLAVSIAFLVALPFLLEGAAWAWGKYAWPWLRPRLLRSRKSEDAEPQEQPTSEDPEDEELS
jgi:signal peptidase I